MFGHFHFLTLVRLALLATLTGLSGLCAPQAKAAPASLASSASSLAMMAPALEGTLNLNTATLAELQLLPGVGPATAAKIVAYRERHPFRSIVHLMRIKGIGRKRFEAMRPYLSIDGETTLRAA